MDFIQACAEELSAMRTSLLISVAICMLTLYYWPVWERGRYPPGPWPLPFLGDRHRILLSSNFMKDFASYSQEVITLHVGGPLAILNSPEAIFEGFVKGADRLSERPPFTVGPIEQLTGGQGLIKAFEFWKDLRRHALTVFKEHGFGSSGMEQLIAAECLHYVSALLNQLDKPFDIKDQLTQSISNIITQVIFGKRIEYSSEQLKSLQFEDFLAIHRKAEYLPFIKYIPGDPFDYYGKKKQFEAGVQFCCDEIASHRVVLDPSNPRDFIDSFLVEQQNSLDRNVFSDANCLATTMQLFIAGTDTTSTALHWGFLQMILHPEVQQRVQLEIDDVIGDRQPLYSDRNLMHYTQAVVTEVLRICIAPASLPHYATSDVEVRGHIIRKGMVVLANLWRTCNDERVFESPAQFKPERFLDDQGQYRKPDKMFSPFSIGRRICLGESLARMELFMFFVMTLQKFKLTALEGDGPRRDGRVHFVYSPYDFRLILTQRG